MIIKRLGVFSVAKISGIMYAAMGLIFGLFISLISLAGSIVDISDGPAAAMGLLFGVGAVIFLPLLYGCMGFVLGAFSAWMYNIIASIAGGIEFEIETEPPVMAGSTPNQPV